jgi:hypothetical protein
MRGDVARCCVLVVTEELSHRYTCRVDRTVERHTGHAAGEPMLRLQLSDLHRAR